MVEHQQRCGPVAEVEPVAQLDVQPGRLNVLIGHYVQPRSDHRDPASQELAERAHLADLDAATGADRARVGAGGGVLMDPRAGGDVAHMQTDHLILATVTLHAHHQPLTGRCTHHRAKQVESERDHQPQYIRIRIDLEPHPLIRTRRLIADDGLPKRFADGEPDQRHDGHRHGPADHLQHAGGELNQVAVTVELAHRGSHQPPSLI